MIPNCVGGQETAIVVLQKDGTFGKRFKIVKSITFGNDRPANIRIKSLSVAPIHAMIDMDSSGVVCVELYDIGQYSI
jgi:pSer/pThr/pTyr-binding forkhead associated (FHA) protein